MIKDGEFHISTDNQQSSVGSKMTNYGWKWDIKEDFVAQERLTFTLKICGNADALNVIA